MVAINTPVRITETEPLSSSLLVYENRYNKELILGNYNEHLVYALGKSALNCEHWVGLIRLGGFHLIVSDVWKINANDFRAAIRTELEQAEQLYPLNPGFSETLDEDIEQTKRIMSDGYLLPDKSVIDYVLLACKDHSGLRLAHHADYNNEHVAPAVRNHTLEVASCVTRIYA